MPFSGFDDFDPRFSEAIQRMIAERPGISINSGYRTPERQAQLFQEALAKYGSVEAARVHVAPPPGLYGSKGSRHNFGLAADLAYATPADREWAHANAERLGLNFRMSHEPWHVELIGGEPTAVADNTGTPVADVGSVTGFLPPRPEHDPRYKNRNPFVPKGYKTDYSIGAVTNTDELLKMLSPRRAAAMEVFKKIKDFS